MKLFRIASCKRIQDISGTGGLYASGRWHSQGTRILYFSEHVSLAKLEVLANSSFLPRKMCLAEIEIKGDFSIVEVKQNQLKSGWDRYPHPDYLKKITSKWINSQESLLLKVPSAQSHSEFNFLMNPNHKDVDQLTILSIEEVKFDQRLKK